MSHSESQLDNPIWKALTTRHAHVARGGSLARRYDAAIGPLSGVREQSPEAYAELARLISADDPAFLFLDTQPRLPAGWRMLAQEPLGQMICRGEPKHPTSEHPIVAMTAGDVPEMLALTALTEPGPFRQRTWELGGFLGIRIDGRLAAMGGQRLAMPGFTEVSAVCTHPDFRRMGLAQALVAAVARGIRARGETPFLTVRLTLPGAIKVYESTGFEMRRSIELAVVLPPAKFQ
jgi:predicted GNAT family acetyltransferase